MAVYHSSFNYLGINSRLKNLVIATFDADHGEVETNLNLEPIYADSAMNLRRHDFGAKWSSVSTFRITVVKPDGGDFSVAEIRNHLKWLTGTYTNTTLELLVGENVKAVFIGRFTSSWQYKMDARTVGIVLEFTSTSPFAYAPKQNKEYRISGSELIRIHCPSDDLFSSVYIKTTYKNTSGSSITLENITMEETTKVTGLNSNETITIDGPNTISSDNPAKRTFGNTFNLVFPRLNPGFNDIQVTGTGELALEYSYPMKIGNVAVDLEELIGTIDCNSNPGEGTVLLEYHAWENIYNKPSTLEGFGITNIYNKTEVDQKFADTESGIESTKEELVQTISNVDSKLNSKIDTTKTELVKADADNKAELESKISDLQTKLENDDAKLQQQIVETNNQIDNAKTELDNKIDNVKQDINNNIVDLQNSVYTKTEIDSKVSSVYKYMGSVANESALPKTGMETGHIYNIETTGMNVAWNGSVWDNLGSVVDLSPYAKKTDVTSALTNVYTKVEVDTLIENIDVTDEVYTKTEVDQKFENLSYVSDSYTKEEIDTKLENITSGGVDISEAQLNNMLAEVLV